MNTAVITTTINVPHVLRLYHRLAHSDVAFYVAGDQKTPHDELLKMQRELVNFWYIGPAQQEVWRISNELGWNNIQRRNIALLEALKGGAEVIISVDDDNYPLANSYFADFAWPFEHGFSGLSYSGEWFDVGQLLIPAVSQRGFPTSEVTGHWYEPAFDCSVGVVQGVCLGDPDISAVDRISREPICHGASELLRAGIVVDPRRATTVFNSQNTAFLREFAPCMCMWPGVGRYDDIFASLVTQRVMQESGHVVYFGQPFVWQQRNLHDLTNDLIAETHGMKYLGDFARILEKLTLQGSILDMAATCLGAWTLSKELVRAWTLDLETVL